MRKIAMIIPFILIATLMFSSISDGKELNLIVLDRNIEVIDEIFEGDTFLIYVTDKNDTSQPLYDYSVSFNDKMYYPAPNDPFCYITAPQVDHDQKMKITVRKEGYKDAYAEITIKNRARLFIYPSTFSVKSGEDLIFEIKDEKGNPIRDVTVKLVFDNKDISSKTDSSGRVVFKVPNVNAKTIAYVEVKKDGYEDVKIDGFISPPSQSLYDKIWNTNFIVVLGLAISLIFFFAGTIRYINRREQLQELYNEEIDEGKVDIGVEKKHEEKVKIEEIEISKPERRLFERKSMITETKPQPVSFRADKPKPKPDTWVIGGDSIIEKIDKKLGEIDDKKRDTTRWLTGKEDIAAKVDEKLKELEKKKRSNPP